MDGCKKDIEKSSTTKVGEHILPGFSVPTISWSKDIEKIDKDCTKSFVNA